MKWMFFALLFVNLSLAAFQWAKQREQAIVPVFEKSSGSGEIKLLSDGMGLSGVGGLDGSRCVLSGPMEAGDRLEKIRGMISDDEIGIGIVEQGRQKAPSYWVYVKNVDVSDKTVEVLEAVGVDFYKIGVGELKGSYSLGVFDNVDLARGLVKKIKKQGLRSQIKEKKKQETTYWLEYELEYAAVNQEKIKKIATFLPKDIKKTEIFCKSVASEK